MKEILGKPGFIVSAGTLGADLSYLLAVVFTSLFLVAWRMAKRGEGTKHHKLILLSMVSMVIYFVGYYYARSLGVLALEGKEGFGGPDNVYDSVFIPILTTHLILVVFGLIMTFYMIWQGFRASEKKDADYILKPGNLEVDPKRFRKILFWIIGLGVLNHLLQTMTRNHFAWQSALAYGLIFGTFALILSLEKLIEKCLPDGAKRHRAMGRFTMVLFALILVTSTATYLMLYVIYPLKPGPI